MDFFGIHFIYGFAAVVRFVYHDLYSSITLNYIDLYEMHYKMKDNSFKII